LRDEAGVVLSGSLLCCICSGCWGGNIEASSLLSSGDLISDITPLSLVAAEERR